MLHHAFGACSANPTTSHIILLKGNTATIYSPYTPSTQLQYRATNQLYPYYTARMSTRCIHPKYTTWIQSLYPQNTDRIHSHCTTSTQPEHTVTVPQYTARIQSLYHQYTARLQSLYHQYTARIQSLYHQYTARLHSHCTTSTQPEYTVTVPQYTARIQSLYHQYTARIQSLYPSTQLEHSHCTPVYS